MAKSSVSRSHGCPGCGGMVQFSTKSCPYCGYEITLADRYEWVDDWVRVSLFLGTLMLGLWTGNFLFHMSKPLLAMLIAVVISFWYLYRLFPTQLKEIRNGQNDSNCAG